MVTFLTLETSSQSYVFTALIKKSPQLINYQTQSVLKHLYFLLFRYNSKRITITCNNNVMNNSLLYYQNVYFHSLNVNFYYAFPSSKRLYKKFRPDLVYLILKMV